MAKSQIEAPAEEVVDDIVDDEDDAEMVIQMVMDHSQHPWLLTNRGRMFKRADDPSRVNEPHGPHFRWVEVAGPVFA